MTRIAAIDVGTNTVLCLVADVHADGRLAVLADEERFARLGEGVDANGRLTEAAMARVLDRLAAAKATAERYDAEQIVIGATSASRDASNTADLAARVYDTLGLDYRVLSGEEEAALTFRGTLAMVPGLDAACVLDIGGGSTEIVVGKAKAQPHYRVSLDVGSVRLTERFLKSQPPAAFQIAEAERTLGAVLGMVPREQIIGLPLVEGGGTAHVLAVLIGETNPAPTVPYATVCRWRDRLLALTPAEVRALDPELLTGREDVTAAAVLLLDAVMKRFGFDAFIASPGGLRHGLALHAAEPS